MIKSRIGYIYFVYINPQSHDHGSYSHYGTFNPINNEPFKGDPTLFNDPVLPTDNFHGYTLGWGLEHEYVKFL
jgi:hypothetical protein